MNALSIPLDPTALQRARSGDHEGFALLVAPFRRELKAHCYRMSGSVQDAEDLVQDALLSAWKALASFEGRSSVRTWLYKIATNTCLNALESKKARGLPADRRPRGAPGEPLQPEPGADWLEPCPPELWLEFEQGPDARYDRRESVALAFMAALQLLPARQRALLILHEVLGWSADECAQLLEMTAPAVHSALQRARGTLAARGEGWRSAPRGGEVRLMLERYLRAWEAADLGALVQLLHEDATLAMPPIGVWLQGKADLEASMGAMVFAGARPGEFRAVHAEANGAPALALYRQGVQDTAHLPYALHLVDWRGERVAAITAFLDTSLFAQLGLPPAL